MKFLQITNGTMSEFKEHIIVDIDPGLTQFSIFIVGGKMLVNDWEDEKGTPPSIDTETCEYCKDRKSAVFSKELGRHLTGREWCERQETCAATIDWEKIAERNEY